MGGTYVLHWPLYSDAPTSRFLCASVPFVATLVFALVGLGAVPCEPLVRSAARSGRRQELLTGPLLYGAVHVLLTLAFWTRSPAGVAAVAVLCFGDGAAELVGRRARAGLWHNKRKTWAGSAACLVAGTAAAAVYVAWFQSLGLFARPFGLSELLVGCGLCGLVGAAVESLPLDGDNLTVPLAVAAAAVAYFGF